jgi:hypothetical protein
VNNISGFESGKYISTQRVSLEWCSILEQNLSHSKTLAFMST